MDRQFNKYDLLKCITIILVVIGHITTLYNSTAHPEMNTSFLEILTTFIYIFHMPLFMAVSGSVYEIGYKKGKYRDFLPFLKNKTYRLLVPYLFVGLFFLLPTLFIINNESWSKLFSAFLLAKGNKHLWFLLSLFWIFIFQFLADKLRIPRGAMFCLALLFSYLKSFGVGLNFYCLQQALHYWPYFILGIMFESNIDLKQSFATMVISIVGIIGCMWGQSALNVFFLDAALHIVGPCFFIVLFYVIATWLIKYFRENKYLTILLDYSFPIYLFHVPVIFLIHHLFRTVSAWALIPIMFILAIMIPIGIAIVLRRLNLQFLIGERHLSN